MNSNMVVGLGFGDEGKGLVTNFLCKESPNSLVVRYSGGQQAGHTVVHNGKRHVFANFGSGTLNGNPTYWSKYCTFDPIGFLNELYVLKSLGVRPIIYIDRNCPITTPFEKKISTLDKNGTCGVGVGATWKREEAFQSLVFSDLLDPIIFKIKFDLICQYYTDVFTSSPASLSSAIATFKQYVEEIRKNHSNKCSSKNLLHECSDNIFESSQGLLLDQHYGFFPHVTKSNVGSPNVLELGFKPECWLVTRAYQTRHGNGPMTNEGIEHHFDLNPKETNVFNKFQGNFQVSLLDLNLLKYAISKDPYISKFRDNLVITCLDQIQNDLRFTYNGKIVQASSNQDFAEKINYELGCNMVYISESDTSKLEYIA